jgi:hypothetical protein
MRNSTADLASALLGEISRMVNAGADTAEIVNYASDQLRTLVEGQLNSAERAEYYRRRLAGEPILRILQQWAGPRTDGAGTAVGLSAGDSRGA